MIFCFVVIRLEITQTPFNIVFKNQCSNQSMKSSSSSSSSNIDICDCISWNSNTSNIFTITIYFDCCSIPCKSYTIPLIQTHSWFYCDSSICSIIRIEFYLFWIVSINYRLLITSSDISYILLSICNWFHPNNFCEFRICYSWNISNWWISRAWIVEISCIITSRNKNIWWLCSSSCISSISAFIFNISIDSSIIEWIVCECVCRSVIPCILIDVQGMSIKTDFTFAWYQKVEYIQSSWTQYIDTWLFSNAIDTVEATFVYTSLPNVVSTVSWVREWDLAFSSIRIADTNYIEPYFDSTALNSNVRLVAWTKYKVKCYYVNYDQKIRVDDVLKNSMSRPLTYYNTRTLYLFAFHDKTSPTYWGAFRMFGCKLYKNNSLVRNFYPVYRKSDNVIWLLDTVNKVFYTNQWSWSFTKWPNV